MIVANRAKVTGNARATFLDVLSKTANVTKACEVANIARRTVYDWKSADAEFAAQWEASLALGIEACESEAFRRAFEGYEEPVYQGGRMVGVVRRYSDALATFMLKAHAPEKYRERSDVHLHGALAVSKMSEAELEAEIAEAQALGLLDAPAEK